MKYEVIIRAWLYEGGRISSWSEKHVGRKRQLLKFALVSPNHKTKDTFMSHLKIDHCDFRIFEEMLELQ